MGMVLCKSTGLLLKDVIDLDNICRPRYETPTHQEGIDNAIKNGLIVVDATDSMLQIDWDRTDLNVHDMRWYVKQHIRC